MVPLPVAFVTELVVNWMISASFGPMFGALMTLLLPQGTTITFGIRPKASQALRSMLPPPPPPMLTVADAAVLQVVPPSALAFAVKVVVAWTVIGPTV